MKYNFKVSAAKPPAGSGPVPSGTKRKADPNAHLGARTRNEPARVAYRDEVPGLNYRKRGVKPLADSIELRRKVAQASLDLEKAHEYYIKAIRAFGALGALPDTIIQDLSPSIRRHMKLYKQYKPQPTKPPYRVLRTVQSESHPGTWHEIREDNLGSIYCTCRGYSNRRHCRHLKEEK